MGALVPVAPKLSPVRGADVPKSPPLCVVCVPKVNPAEEAGAPKPNPVETGVAVVAPKPSPAAVAGAPKVRPVAGALEAGAPKLKPVAAVEAGVAKVRGFVVARVPNSGAAEVAGVPVVVRVINAVRKVYDLGRLTEKVCGLSGWSRPQLETG